MPFREPQETVFARYFRYGWNRLQARSRRDDFSDGLAARTADPLWALARQWQLLELKGEDAGTPIHVQCAYEEAAVNRIQLGAETPEAIGGIPVEVLVEREALDWDWRMRVRAGQHFERLVRLESSLSTSVAEQVIESVRVACPIERPTAEDWIDLDNASRRFVSLMEGRAIDGGELLAKIAAGSAPQEIPSTVQEKFKNWYKSLYSQDDGEDRTSPAWNSEQLDYEFRLRTEEGGTPGSLHAASYRSGTVDWADFSSERPTQTFDAKEPLELTPVHVTYAGQPAKRWWEFEDHAVNLGSLDTATTDLAKLVLTEFALVFGDDWFIVPLTTLPNTLVRIQQLLVRDCFGLTTEISPAKDVSNDPLTHWEVFALAPTTASEISTDFLFVPPISGVREESPILEEVRFARDEDANCVFAIELTVPNQIGDPVGGFAAHLERLRRWRDGDEALSEALVDEEAGEVAVDAEPTVPPPNIEFSLATQVPSNWIPFIATDAQNVASGVPRRSVRLQRGAMISTEGSDGQRQILGLSRLLQPGEFATRVKWIREEAVGREGARIELRRQRVRSPTGETYVWLGRRAGPGKGEARSGLRFDAVEPRG